MAITQVLLNMDKMFAETTGKKIILNDLSTYSTEDAREMENCFWVKQESANISTVPTCDCPNGSGLVGEYYKGRFCPECGSICESELDKTSSSVWFRALDPSIPFLNPTYWIMLEKKIGFSKSTFDLIGYLTNSSYKPPNNQNKEKDTYIQEILQCMENKRGYLHFITNLESILEYVYTHAKTNAKKREAIGVLLDMYKHRKDVVFSQYLPLVPKSIFIKEINRTGSTIDFKATYNVKAANKWINRCTNMREGKVFNKNTLANDTGVVLRHLTTLYHEFIKNNVLQKRGLLRQHVYGTRSPQTFRCVIIPISGKHQHDELRIPWVVGLTTFQLPIMNKLINKYKVNYYKAREMWATALKKYNPFIDQILQELKSEAKDGKLNTILQRNPSLLKGSMLLTHIGEIKKDPDNLTLSISPLVCKQMNADFDGDQCNCMYLSNNKMVEIFEPLRPAYNTLGVVNPYEISGNLSLLASSNITMQNYLSDNTRAIPKEQDTVYKALKV